MEKACLVLSVLLSLLMSLSSRFSETVYAQAKEVDSKEILLRRDIVRALGKSPKGYFLVATREITSAPKEDVEFDSKLMVFDDRDSATDHLAEYLKDNPEGRRGFRLVERFDPTPIGKDASDEFRAALEKSVRAVKLPQLTTITVGIIQPTNSEQVIMGPKGIQITMVRQLPKGKKAKKVVLELP